MAIVAGYDVHRQQITFDALDSESGELHCGRIDSTPAAVRAWVERFRDQEVQVAVEACTGWLFVCEALAEAGATAHLADPAEAAAKRGKKRRAKTDRADARHLRQLLAEGRLPEAWIPPAHVREWRSRCRLLSAAGRRALAALALPIDARERIEVALAMIDALEHELAPLERQIRSLARRQPGCRALQRHFGIGELTAPTILCELGDVSRLSSSRKAVRSVGLDIGVHRSDRRSRLGKRAGRSRGALGAVRGRPVSLPTRKPRPPGIPRPQGARPLAHPRLAHNRAQARPPLLPHPTRARPGSARTGQRLSDATRPRPRA